MLFFRKRLKRWFFKFGYEFRKLSVGELSDLHRLVQLTSVRAIQHFLDVGANQGQFGIDLRFAGYRGRIISFEPLKEAHALLTQRAERDGAWLVAERMALGRTVGNAQINVSENSYSSSLLPIRERHVQCAPESAYSTREEVKLDTLDNVLPRIGISATEPLSLKIDAQGYEAEVLAGGKSSLQQVQVLYTELSLVELYTGAPTFDELYAHIRGLGYRCVGLSHEMSEPRSGEMLQVNGTFVRD